MSNVKFRENEQLLRRCRSIAEAKKLVPDLIVQMPSSSGIYHLSGLDDYCFCIPSYLNKSEMHALTEEILEDLIDSPHANSFPNNETGLWKEYVACSAGVCRLKRLRWSCVGYHYNWTDRSYSKNEKTNFPSSLERIWTNVLSKCPEIHNTPKCESAIINFYHSHRPSDRLGGHRDDVEVSDDSPLVSISMGLCGIFLIENIAMVLYPGDVLVLTGKARQSLHGVPCVFAQPTKKGASPSVSSFLDKTRISISIRQVY